MAINWQQLSGQNLQYDSNLDLTYDPNKFNIANYGWQSDDVGNRWVANNDTPYGNLFKEESKPEGFYGQGNQTGSFDYKNDYLSKLMGGGSTDWYDQGWNLAKTFNPNLDEQSWLDSFTKTVTDHNKQHGSGFTEYSNLYNAISPAVQNATGFDLNQNQQWKQAANDLEGRLVQQHQNVTDNGAGWEGIMNSGWTQAALAMLAMYTGGTALAGAAGGTGTAAGTGAASAGSSAAGTAGDLGLLESAAGTTGFGSPASAAWELGDYALLGSGTPSSTGGSMWDDLWSEFGDVADYGDAMPNEAFNTGTMYQDIGFAPGSNAPPAWYDSVKGYVDQARGAYNTANRGYNLVNGMMGGGGQGGGRGGYQVAGNDLLGSLYGMYSQNQLKQQLERMMNTAQGQADPFGPNRGAAATTLMDILQNPTRQGGYIDQAMQPFKNRITAADAAAGRTSQVGEREAQMFSEAMRMLPQITQPFMQASGANVNPAGVAQVTQGFANPMTQALAGRFNAGGMGMNALLQGQQPSMMDMLFGSASPQGNQGLLEMLMKMANRV